MLCSGAASCILLVGVEALTTIVDPEDRSTSVLFGDGAGAVVLERVMHSGENRIEMRIPRSGGLLHDFRFPHS